MSEQLTDTDRQLAGLRRALADTQRDLLTARDEIEASHDAMRQIAAQRDEARAALARVEALAEHGDSECYIEGGQPNGLGIIEPSDYREWFHEARESHHRLVVTLYGPWVEGPARGVPAPSLRAALAGGGDRE